MTWNFYDLEIPFAYLRGCPLHTKWFKITGLIEWYFDPITYVHLYLGNIPVKLYDLASRSSNHSPAFYVQFNITYQTTGLRLLTSKMNMDLASCLCSVCANYMTVGTRNLREMLKQDKSPGYRLQSSKRHNSVKNGNNQVEHKLYLES